MSLIEVLILTAAVEAWSTVVLRDKANTVWRFLEACEPASREADEARIEMLRKQRGS